MARIVSIVARGDLVSDFSVLCRREKAVVLISDRAQRKYYCKQINLLVKNTVDIIDETDPWLSHRADQKNDGENVKKGKQWTSSEWWRVSLT